MTLATLLRYSANVFMGAAMIRWVASDLVAEIRRDIRPYRFAGAVTAMGVVAGMLLAQQHRHGRT
jgi:hypothetical protein